MTNPSELRYTGHHLDLATEGDKPAYFRVYDEDGQAHHTRSVSCHISAARQLVDKHGRAIVPGITVPDEMTRLYVWENGQVCVETEDEPTARLIGKIHLFSDGSDARTNDAQIRSGHVYDDDGRWDLIDRINRAALVAGMTPYEVYAEKAWAQTDRTQAARFGAVRQLVAELSHLDQMPRVRSLADDERAVYDMVREDRSVCGWQLTAEEQTIATRLTRRELLESSPGDGCGKRHYRVS